MKNGTYRVTREGKIENYGEKWAFGYFVATTNNIVKPGELTEDTIRAFAADNGGRLVGVWTDPKTGETYLDATVHLASRRDAINLGNHHGQLAIWDVMSNKEIML